MLDRKSLVLLASLFGFALASTSVYAHTYKDEVAPTNNFVMPVTIPNLKPGFEFSIAAIALAPSASNLNYAIYNKALPLLSPNWREQELNPGYSGAFELGVRYIFANQNANDIQLDWTHLNSRTTGNISADGIQFFIGPDYEIGPDAASIRNASGSATFRYDMVNLDAGQFLSFGQHVMMRFFGGLSAGSLQEEVKATFTGTNITAPVGPFSFSSDTTSNFTGIGPRAGMEMSYRANNGFGILGEAAVSALIGGSHSTMRFSTTTSLFTNNPQSIVDQNTTQVIPGFDAKLGISYQHECSRGSLFTIQAGYQAAVYINAINQYSPGTYVATEPVQTGGLFVSTMNHTQSNYSVQGPFVKFAVQF